MIVKVRMIAYENSTPGRVIFREVEIPDNLWEAATTKKEKLSHVFYYGQNDVQPRDHCSVSVGDVIESEGELWLVHPDGFQTITEERVQELLQMPRSERTFSLYREDFNARS